MELLRVQFDCSGFFIVNCLGQSRGLAVLWRDNVKVTVKSFSQNYIYTEVVEGNNSHCRVTTFYGYPERARRRDSWQMMRTLASTSDLHW